MHIEHENSFKQALTGGLNFFAGAGFSLLAHDRHGQALPLASTLCTELRDAFGLASSDDMSLRQVTTILNGTRSVELHKFLRDRFTVHRFDERYRSLRSLNIQCLATTNIDDLFFQIYTGHDGKYLNDIDYRGPSFADNYAIDAIWLHGCVRHPNREFVFSSLDIAAAFQRDSSRWQTLSSVMEKRPTLFVGHSLEDADVLQALHPDTAGGRHRRPMWATFPAGLTATDVKYIRTLGFQLIEADVSDFLDYCTVFGSTSAPRPLPKSDWNTARRFPNEAIPNPGLVANRPIIQFLCGAPPTWSDIYSHQLHRTAHHSHLRDLLDGNKDFLAVGIPVCGKTTLMMQLAVDVPFSGHKLVLGSVSVERAASVLRRLNGDPAIIFVDQCCDDIDGFMRFANAPNVVAAGFDAEYNLEIVSHLVPKSKVSVVSVTEISDADIQSILRTLPQGSVRPERVHPRVEGIGGPSLFETIENNLRTSTLRERYLDVMAKLEQQDINAHDLLLVNCYVHSCRVPVSLDMLIAYYGDSVNGHEDIYRIRDTLGALIVDAPDAVVEDNQDYYTPRSTAVSEAVLSRVTPYHLRRMLVQFHDRVRRHRIARYDVFRRHGYDHKIMSRAFGNWREGMEFYEKLCLEDESPYMKQHGALYLMERKRFDEAFHWIDEAVTKTQGRNFTIRNSHARVLFEANIQKDHRNDVVKSMLFQSMDVLSECYASDRRKTYHAIVFTDQAKRLADIYGIDSVARHLERALAWLDEEIRRYPWHRRARQMKDAALRRLRGAKPDEAR